LLALVLAVIESIIEVGAPDGVTTSGEKVHAVPAGKPEQLNDTSEEKPLTGVNKMVVVPLHAGPIKSDPTEAEIEKSGFGTYSNSPISMVPLLSRGFPSKSVAKLMFRKARFATTLGSPLPIAGEEKRRWKSPELELVKRGSADMLPLAPVSAPHHPV
jgi:hypothetical protein